jgi:uncharacterized protein
VTVDSEVLFYSHACDIPQDLWARLLPPPIEGLWWYDSLERSSLEDQFEFAYAVVRQDDTPVAIAPLFRMDVPIEIVAPPAIAWMLRQAGRLWPRLPYQRTLFVGSPCSEEGTVGIAEHVDLAAIVAIIHRALRERAKMIGAPMIVWKDFPEKAWPALRALGRNEGLFEVVSFPNTVIVEVGGTFEVYLNQLTGRRRYRLRKKLRRSRRAIDLYGAVVTRPDGRLIDEIWPLFLNTYNKAKVRFERLTKQFWLSITEQEVGHLIILRESTTHKPVAFMLVFLSPGYAINKFIGIDYSCGTESYLYFRLWEEFVRFAQHSGATILQSGQTGYGAKLALGHELVPLSNFARHQNPIIHFVFALVAKGINWSTLDPDLRVFARSKGQKSVKQPESRM